MTNIADKPHKPEKALNADENADSGVETQNSEGNAEEEEPVVANVYYDKTKSFFDNISSDDTRHVPFALLNNFSIFICALWYW